MNLLLIAMIIVLLFVNGWQYFLKRKAKHELNEICDKLARIIELETAEKVFIQTNQHEVQRMLIQVNRLLNYKQKVFADSVKSKEGLRKMLSNISHDLKTPLTVILGYTEKLQHNGNMVEEKQIEVVDRLHKKTLIVIDLINKFFDTV